MSRPGPRKDTGELRPRIGGAHVDNAYRPESRFWRFDPEQSRSLSALNATPELAFGREDEMLIKRIGIDLDLYPLPSAGNHRQHRVAGGDDPHIVLQLGHIFFRRRLLGERP